MKVNDKEFLLFLLGTFGVPLINSLLCRTIPSPLKEALSFGIIILCVIIIIYIV